MSGLRPILVSWRRVTGSRPSVPGERRGSPDPGPAGDSLERHVGDGRRDESPSTLHPSAESLRSVPGPTPLPVGSPLTYTLHPCCPRGVPLWSNRTAQEVHDLTPTDVRVDEGDRVDRKSTSADTPRQGVEGPHVPSPLRRRDHRNTRAVPRPPRRHHCHGPPRRETRTQRVLRADLRRRVGPRTLWGRDTS